MTGAAVLRKSELRDWLLNAFLDGISRAAAAVVGEGVADVGGAVGSLSGRSFRFRSIEVCDVAEAADGVSSKGNRQCRGSSEEIFGGETEKPQ